MAGLAGADQGGAGLGDDPDGRIARLLKDLSVALPLGFVPAGRAADVKAAVLALDQAAGHVEFAQDTAREAPYIPHDGRVRQKAALEAQAALRRVRRIAGLLSDQELARAQAGIGRDKAARLPDGHDRGLCLVILF